MDELLPTAIKLAEKRLSADVINFSASQSSVKKGETLIDTVNNILSMKVDMVVSFNLRSLKNYFTLRESGAAFFQIRWLAQEMMRVTPSKYLDLIIKKSS